MTRNNRIVRAMCFVGALVLLVTGLSVTASAASSLPYDSYTFQNNGLGMENDVADAPIYEVTQVLDGRLIGEIGFSGITDMCVTADGIYVLDAGNNRVLVLNLDYTFHREVRITQTDGTPVTLNAPKGIFVDAQGRIYIADTENQRVLICGADGRIAETIASPSATVLPEDFQYYPIDMLTDHNGFLYILTRGSYYGAMLFNEKREFVGFYGANTVTVEVLDWFADLFRSLFETNEKLAASEQNLPYQFSDFVCDEKGFIYTVSTASEKKAGQIRRLNAQSGNTLKYRDGLNYVVADSLNFAERETYINPTGMPTAQNFTGIALDADGYVYALDKAYGKIYVYNRNCECITVFGGGMGSGTYQGLFLSPTDVAVCGADVLVADELKNTITVFRRTPYGQALMQADTLTVAGEFEQAKPLWEEALQHNANNYLACSGLAKVYLNEKNYPEAMRYARLGLDVESYSLAFQQVENAFLSDHFIWLFLAALALIAGVTAFCMVVKRKQLVLIGNEKLRIALRTVLHPFESFQEVKFKQKGSVCIAVILMLLYYVVSVAVDLWGGFMYVMPDPRYNALFTLGGTVGIILLWSVCNWGVTTLLEGKGTFKEVFIVTCYSLTPMIAYELVYLVCTYLIVPSNTSMLDIVGVVCTLLSAVLLIIGLITIHEYSFFKAVGSGLITIAGMLFAGFILFMVFTLGQNCIMFILNLFVEAIYR